MSFQSFVHRAAGAATLSTLLVCAQPVESVAQEEDSPAPSTGAFDDAARRRFYESQKLDATPTMLSNLLIPGLGNVRTEQYLLGAALMSISFMGVLSMIGGATLREETDTGFVILGASALGLALGTSMVTTSFGVKAYNQRLRNRYKVDVSQGSPLGLTVTWRF